jgi:hypothetical protein
MSWCACVSLTTCSSCAAPIHPGEGIYWGEQVNVIRYCVACAKTRLDMEPPAVLPTVRTSGAMRTADVKAMAADLRERILEWRRHEPLRFDARQAQIARE